MLMKVYEEAVSESCGDNIELLNSISAWAAPNFIIVAMERKIKAAWEDVTLLFQMLLDCAARKMMGG